MFTNLHAKALCLVGLSSLCSGDSNARPYFDNRPKFKLELPPDSTKTGSLKINGAAGPDQNTQAYVYYCVPELFSANQKGACLYSFSISLNAIESRIPVGNVLVEYSSSAFSEPVPIREGKASVLSLVDFEVPEMAGRYEFRMFQDLKNRIEQKKLMQFLWRTSDLNSIEEYCRMPIQMSKSAKMACAAWKGNEYKALLDTWLQFNERAEYSVASFSSTYNHVTGQKTLDISWSPFSRNYTAKGEDGESLSIPPGVYGLELIYESGSILDQYNIDLRHR